MRAVVGGDVYRFDLPIAQAGRQLFIRVTRAGPEFLCKTPCLGHVAAHQRYKAGFLVIPEAWEDRALCKTSQSNHCITDGFVVRHGFFAFLVQSGAISFERFIMDPVRVTLAPFSGKWDDYPLSDAGYDNPVAGSME